MSVETFAFLDDGATLSIIDEKLTKKVGLSGDRIEMSLIGIKGEKFKISNCRKMDVDVFGQFGKQQIKGIVSSSNVKMPT